MEKKEIRNFVIIAHIDHGKSTLADRFLELTGTIAKEKMKPQFLDMMELEREKGITIKMQPVRMNYNFNQKPYILNLIDTPGHVDFNYEVSRALAAVEGAILLVDATQGIQAQTLANLELAKKQGLVIIPAINKIDMSIARVEETVEELANFLGIDRNEVLRISAKQGTNVSGLLEQVVRKIPEPKQELEKPFRALIFDSKYDVHKGVLAYVRVMEGRLTAGEKIYLMRRKVEAESREIGYFKPSFSPQNEILAGEIGYIATGIKEPEKVRAGDTITSLKFKVQNLNLPEPLSGYLEPKPMVFANIFPENPDDFENLKAALAKLKLEDASLVFEPKTNEVVGRGFSCGFLGTLHAEIISERLRREFKLNLVISAPSVVFKILNTRGKEILIYSLSDWPQESEIKEIYEPWVRLEVVTPQSFFGKALELLECLEGKQIEIKYLSANRPLLIYETPLREIILGFYDKLKGASQGYASMNYEVSGYMPGDLIKLDILVAGKKEEPLSRIVSRKKAFLEGKRIVEKLKEILPAQLFSVAIQAVLGGKIIARETIGAKRRDVIAPLYGGDYTRKMKLLEKQKKGKKKLKARGEVRIPQKVYLEIFKSL